MQTVIEERACDLAVYLIEKKATVRAAAKKFGISKSTVHKVVTNMNGSISQSNNALKQGVSAILDC